MNKCVECEKILKDLKKELKQIMETPIEECFLTEEDLIILGDLEDRRVRKQFKEFWGF